MKIDIMKKLALILLGCSLVFNFAAFAEPTQADQKWLEAVQKMVADGQKTVSTPNAERVNLLKEWGARNGCSVKVTKTDTGYSIEVSKQLAQK